MQTSSSETSTDQQIPCVDKFSINTRAVVLEKDGEKAVPIIQVRESLVSEHLPN